MPAVGAGLLSDGGSLTAAFVGSTSRNGHTAVHEHDRWHIGSCLKSMTAALYARLVERGDASWEMPITELLPDPTNHPGWKAVSIDHVLLHTGGVPPNLDRRQMQRAWTDPAPIRDQRLRIALSTLQRPPTNPGAVRYSNLGYLLVGAAIEHLCGSSFEEALLEHLLLPLDMRSGGWGAPARPLGHPGRLALASVHVGRGRPVDPTDLRADNPPVMSPAGRLHIELADWAKFQLVFLNDGADFLQPATVNRLVSVGSRKNAFAMGWAPGPAGSNVSVGQQGSNTMWVATALLNNDYSRAAMVVCNDGRTRLIPTTGQLAMAILDL